MQAALAGRDGTRSGHWAAWTVMAATLTELLRAPAWSRCLCRTSRRRFFRPKLPPLWRASDALPRLRQLLGVLPDGSPLAAFLPQLGTEEPDSALRALRGACQHADSQPGTRARWRARVGSERGVDAGAGQTPRCGAGDLLREQLAKYGRELAASRKTIHARRRPTVADSRGSPIPLERQDRIIRTSNSRHRHLYASNDSIRSRRTSWWP
jgi:hypothetical protein